jgi:hypothetical protein
MLEKARELMYPDIYDASSARIAAKHGFWAALVNASLCLVIGIVMASGSTGTRSDKIGTIVIGILIIFVGIFILRMSRISAVIGFIISLMELILNVVFARNGIIVGVFLAIYYFNGVRGTFGYHKYIKMTQ